MIISVMVMVFCYLRYASIWFFIVVIVCVRFGSLRS